MSGTPLPNARFAGLLSTIGKTLATLQLSNEVAESWEKNDAELALRLAFLTEIAPVPKSASRKKPKFQIQPDGTITFTVKSDGTTGETWVSRLEVAGHKVSDYAKQVLRSPDFVPTKGVVTKLVVLPGKMWSDRDRPIKNIRDEAQGSRKLGKPNAEVGCLIRMMFSNDDIIAMGLRWLVTMHEPIKDSGGNPRLLGADVDLGSASWLSAHWDDPDSHWDERDGFVFAVSQV